MSFDLGDYVDVAERIARFYDTNPDGRIVATPASVVELDGRTFLAVTASVYRTPDDPTPSVGSAWEPFPGRTPYTKDSEAMNAETSAVGRALALAGIEVRRSIASRDEVRNRRDQPPTEPDTTAHVSAADKARAAVTFDRLKLAKGTDLAGSVRALADYHGQRLTLAALTADPEWRVLVDQHLDAAPHLEPDPQPEGDAPSTGSRGRADDATIGQIRDAAARLDLSDDDLLDVARNVIGRDVATIDRLTRGSAAKVATELLTLVAALDTPATS